MMQAKNTDALDRLESYFFHPDFVVHVGGSSRVSGTYSGWSAYRDRMILGEVGTPAKLKGIRIHGDTVVLRTHLRGARVGKTVDLDVVFHFRFAGARLIEQRSVPADEHAWSEFWS